MGKASFREFKTLFPYLARYRTRYVWGFICLITVDVAQMVIPQFMRQAVDLIASGDFRWEEVLIPAGGMVAVMAVISLGRFLWRYFIHGASRRIETEMRERLFEHLLTLSYDFYQKNKIGDLMARATNDLNAVRESIGMGLVALIDGTVMAVSILAIIFLQDPETAALAVIPLPLITLIILFFGSAVGKKFHKAQETYSAMSDTVQETFMGIRVVKSFVKEWWFIKKFADANDDYRDANMALVKLYGVFFPFITLLSGLTSLIVLLIGGIRVVEGFISPGDLVALFRYLQMLIWPLMGAGFVVNMIQRGAVSLGRVNEALKVQPAIASPETPEIPADTPTEPAIEIRRMSFAYPAGTPVLEDITLAIGRGVLLGILGRTGSGKTTLIKALTRMIDPPADTVFVKGLAVERWDLQALRGCFGVAPQDSYLFSDSVKNNIRYGLQYSETHNFFSKTHNFFSKAHEFFSKAHETFSKAHETFSDAHEASSDAQKMSSDAQKISSAAHEASSNAQEILSAAQEISQTAQKISQTARLAKAAEISSITRDLKTFSGGWDTVIGERGLTLSGGQKQRVAISRAIIGEPEILILDDALSAVDAETEKRILTALLKERQGKTTIIISHRVSTLKNADYVAVLDKGRITEYGSPADLAVQGGFYAKTAALQQLDQPGEES
ncbi:MAG: ATP-binding cassette domain-containing protein [Spirochaetaceae bacterium]|jgi:ATP-binding cassette subfamily B protein|nr:ATP-binding cassette domain-containing protein [Spirochaetaceae bacterium]